MINLNYNLKRHIELLKQKKKILNENKCFLKENQKEWLELKKYDGIKKVNFLSLDLPYSSDMAVKKLIATNLAAIATFETERRKERQREGIEAARKAAKSRGRKTVITKKLIAEVQDLKENKNLSITQIAKVTGKGRNTIFKVLKNE